MADEAAVENLPVNRFFCHKCSREITGVLPDFTCPNCQSGFIEALEAAEPEPTEDSDSEIEVRPFEFFNEMLMSLNTPDDYRMRGTNRSGARRNTRANRSRQMAPLENIIQDFLVNISGVGFGAGSIGIGQRGGQVLFLGNPGDYAWGREGLDAIVTQLLNQMDTTGPPPLAKEKIQEIPSVVITQDQVDLNLQCSVCWEDFKIEEQVRKLPCEHVYHENCIVPWLELHGTCPICRKTLSDDPQADDSENATNPVGTSLAALFRVANETANASAAGVTSGANSSNSRGSSTSGTDASTSSSNITGDTAGNTSSSSSSRPDFNMDIDFD